MSVDHTPRSRLLVEHLRARIRHEGPLSFRDFMDDVLYHPEFGYYCSAANPIGREGDFYTSSDLDPVFGKLLARKFTQLAAHAGIAPESFTIVELGAGTGRLARDILSHGSFPYRIVERSHAMRARQRESLRGFDVGWDDDLPHGITGCVFSNEFFDALPVHRVVRRNGILREIYVTGEFAEIEGGLSAPLAAITAPVQENSFAEINLEAAAWVRRIAQRLHCGYHLAIDYGYLEDEFYAWPGGTLMSYWRHRAVEDPYARIGEQDITAHVNFTALIEEGRKNGLETVEFSTQMNFLSGIGILDDLEALAHAGTAESMARLTAIKKLILPDAMGQRFKALLQRQAAGGDATAVRGC